MGSTWNPDGTLDQPWKTVDSMRYTYPKQERKNIRHNGFTPPKIQQAKTFFHRCNHSCRTLFNSCTTKSIACQPPSHTRKFPQGSIDIPSRYIWKRNLPSSIYEGDSQGGIPRETPTGEPRRKNNNSYQSKQPFAHAEPLRMTIVESYPEKLKQENP